MKRGGETRRTETHGEGDGGGEGTTRPSFTSNMGTRRKKGGGKHQKAGSGEGKVSETQKGRGRLVITLKLQILAWGETSVYHRGEKAHKAAVETRKTKGVQDKQIWPAKKNKRKL